MCRHWGVGKLVGEQFLSRAQPVPGAREQVASCRADTGLSCLELGSQGLDSSITCFCSLPLSLEAC